MALPNLGALDLGPPTGPIVEWKRQCKKTRAQTCEQEQKEGPQICPISQEPLVDGEDYYSFPGSEGKTAYEIPKIYEYFVHRTLKGEDMVNPLNSDQEVPPEDWRAIKKWMHENAREKVVPGMEYDGDDRLADAPPSRPVVNMWRGSVHRRGAREAFARRAPPQASASGAAGGRFGRGLGGGLGGGLGVVLPDLTHGTVLETLPEIHWRL